MSDTEDFQDETDGLEDDRAMMTAEGGPAQVSTDAAGVQQTVVPSEAAPQAGAAAPSEAAPQAGAAPPAEAGTVPEGAVFRVKVMYSSQSEFCSCPAGIACVTGDLVVVPTKHGNELGRVLGPSEEPPEGVEQRAIVRVATSVDLSRIGELEVKEERAFSACREKISARGLEMKLVSAHYLLDEQKILFFFTAENRIDFRELVKDLVAVFKMRIELRQIGVRDEARVIGGVGICGRVLCCNSITDRLRPVSIKMAKEQNLTLNSMKISGPCGRLLCCLSYEFDTYREARQQLPSLGTRITYDGEDFKVTDLNVLARRIRFQGASGRVLDLGFDALGRSPGTNSWEIRVRTASGS